MGAGNISDDRDRRSIYSFAVKTANGKKQRLSEFRGRTLFLVNVDRASRSDPRYTSLEKLQRKYGPKGLEVVSFSADGADALRDWLKLRASECWEITWDGTFSRSFNQFLINDSGVFITGFGPDVDPFSFNVTSTVAGHLPEPTYVWGYPGYVVWLQSKTGKRFPTFVFKADTDMATDGLESLTSTNGNELVLASYSAAEYRLGQGGHAGYLKGCQMLERRANRKLGRTDLRVVWSDAGFTRHRDIFAENQWARKTSRQDPSAFVKKGGKITKA